jgi:DNA-binding NtrC family response regulator
MQVVRFGSHAHAPMSMDASIDYGSEAVEQNLIGVSRWAQTARMLIGVHACHDNAVLFEGERGTGKKLLARLIHRFSSRHQGPFVSLALGSASDDLARSALFGGREERFDGVGTREKGLAELAQGGTLYIDGISHLSSSLTGEIIRLAQLRRARGERSARPPWPGCS